MRAHGRVNARRCIEIKSTYICINIIYNNILNLNCFVGLLLLLHGNCMCMHAPNTDELAGVGAFSYLKVDVRR